MSNVFPRQITNPPIKAVSSDGCYIIDENGKQYLDGSGGAAVSCLGHGDPDVIKAVQDQTSKMAFAHTGFFSSDPAEELAELLIDNAPGELDRVYFVSGGSEAIEAAIKLARQFHIENGEPSRHHIIARKQSYHGNTLGALAAGGNKWRRNQFEPILIDASHISPCYEYVDKLKEETSFDYGQRVAQELEDEILRLGTDKVMAFIVEPVVGATMGAVPAVPGYFKKVRNICDKYGVLLILDEVMCGMGRTGHLFASEFDEIAPDILCIAKGLGAGYQPIGAMLCSKNIYNRLGKGSGFFQHGHTYMGHPVACAAALAVLKAILNRKLLSSIKSKSNQLFNCLETQLGHHPNIGDIRGRGLFIGIEIVKNIETKKPFDPNLKVAASIKHAAFEAGLICYPMSGTRDGKWGDHILLAPPFIINENQIIELVNKLSISIKSLK
ncbi:aspartate aminotransferase family protein [Amylibacter sp.]|jgi:adenosylmethionine-8-amino-7-oxononanoate aminotransferase|nr:aspartate aminotransferase family protein [Amylibacter sp.]MDB0000945.1 aspartate aminotransferase family protein [Amylibacter sp.]MDB4085025.1 aspartate aminotransferase family protein [Amylibacter sp.]